MPIEGQLNKPPAVGDDGHIQILKQRPAVRTRCAFDDLGFVDLQGAGMVVFVADAPQSRPMGITEHADGILLAGLDVSPRPRSADDPARECSGDFSSRNSGAVHTATKRV